MMQVAVQLVLLQLLLLLLPVVQRKTPLQGAQQPAERLVAPAAAQRASQLLTALSQTWPKVPRP